MKIYFNYYILADLNFKYVAPEKRNYLLNFFYKKYINGDIPLLIFFGNGNSPRD